MPEPTLRQTLKRSHGSVLRLWIARHALVGAAWCAAAIVLAVWLGAILALGVGGSWVRLALLLGVCAASSFWAVARFRGAAPSFDKHLEEIEWRFPQIRSWLRNALDLEQRPSPHTSPELTLELQRQTAKRLAEVPLARMKPRLEARRPLMTFGVALVAVIALAALMPGRAKQSWATLWTPAAAAPPVRLAVEPGAVKITPGAALAVRAKVWGTSQAPRLLRDRQPALAATPEGATGDGGRTWRFDLTQLTRDQDYRVRVASVESPRYHISLAGEPAPVSFEVEYRSPGYARLPVQRGAATRGDLTALRGTRAHLVVTFDRDLSTLTAMLPDGQSRRWTSLTPRRWEGDVTIEREGHYELAAVAERGEGRFRYRVTPVADAPPVIAVRMPSGDLDLPEGQKIPVEILGQDDLGLSELKLQYRKDAASAWTDVPLARFVARPREARVEATWDASPLALLPGENGLFRFELYDDNAISGRGVAVSPTFQLRFPSLADLYERMDDRQAAAQTSLEKVAEHARDLQKSLDKLSRQVQPSPQSPQSFERSEEFRNALERQQQLGQQIDEAARQLQQTLQEASERDAFDQQLTRKLQELAALMEQVQSPEFREAMKRMQEALENLNRKTLEQDLAQWRKENQEMMANLDRTIELLKKLREEEKLQSLAQRAEELKAQQDALNQQRESQSDSEASKSQSSKSENNAEAQKQAEEQREAASESEQLAQDTKEAAEQMQGTSQQEEEMQKAAEELSKEAAPAQREASQSQQQGQRSQANQSGRKASQSLQSAAQRLRSTAQSAQQQQNDLDLAAVRRAAQDLVSLQRATEQNLDSDNSPSDKADRQTDLSEGTSRVADSLFALARQTPFISPKLSEALGRAINNLAQSGRDMGSGNRGRGEEAGRSAGQSLNEAVLELREAESSMCQNPGNKPGGRSSAQRMSQMGQRQSQLNRDTRSLAQRLSEQMRLSAGDRQQLERLAEEQQRIREQLEQIQREEESKRELLGKLDQAQREMKDVEEVLRSGQADGTLEQKQQRILSRLLDAQRSVNRRDFEPQRESRPGEDVARVSPGELPRELLRETDRLRLDLLKAEADRYPAQYRAFVEAYLRSLNEARR